MKHREPPPAHCLNCFGNPALRTCKSWWFACTAAKRAFMFRAGLRPSLRAQPVCIHELAGRTRRRKACRLHHGCDVVLLGWYSGAEGYVDLTTHELTAAVTYPATLTDEDMEQIQSVAFLFPELRVVINATPLSVVLMRREEEEKEVRDQKD